MRILHVCLVGEYNEGWSYQENLLSKFHAKLGHTVMLICIPYELSDKGPRLSTDQEYINKYGVHVKRLSEKISLFGKLIWYNGVYDTISQFHPDVLFVHGCQFVDIKTLVKYARKHLELVIFVDNHADFSNSATNWISKNILHKIIWKHFAKMIEPYTTKFYGVLPARVDFLTDVYRIPREKCELLVMGADDDEVEKAHKNRAREKIREKYNIHDDDFLIVTGGKINKYRPETLDLMEAVSSINHSRIKLLVFGSVFDELKDRFEELSQSNSIIYVGWLKSEETYEFFEAADLIAFPGLHSVMWEQAVAQGIPCLFRDIEGFHHVDLDGNAIFVSDVSKEGLKKEIIDLYENPRKIETMKSIAKEKGKQVFSYRSIAQRCLTNK